jgi:Spy/CpxP family protein refolding chaperone
MFVSLDVTKKSFPYFLNSVSNWQPSCNIKNQNQIQKGETHMKKTVIAVGLAVVMLLGVTYVYAGGRGYGPGSGRGNCAGFRGASDVSRCDWGRGGGRGNYGEGWGVSNLTSEQQTKMRELRQKHHNEVAPLREKMFSMKEELRVLWSDPKADSKAIEAKTKEMNVLRDQMRDKGVQFRLEARSLLTPEQIKAFGSGCGQGCGKGGGAGPGRGPGRGRGRC